MFNPKQIQTAFQSLIGIRQSNIPGVPVVLPTLSDSDTGIYVDDKNPLVSTENIYYSSPNFAPSTYPAWVLHSNYATGASLSYSNVLYIAVNPITNSTVTPLTDSSALPWVSGGPYTVGQISTYLGIYYICIVNNTSVITPNLDGTNWSIYTHVWNTYDPFQNLLQQKYNQAASNLFFEVFKKKKLLYMGKAILERIQLYRGGGSINTKIIPQGRFVGFQILPEQAEGLWVFIEQIGFQATEANPDMKFYLYHSDKMDAEGYMDADLVSELTFQWFDAPVPDFVMKYLQNNTTGMYFVGYYEDDVVGYALSKAWDCQAFPCPGCDGIDMGLYNQWSRYTTIRNIAVPASALQSDRTLFDTSKITYDALTNWGMNLSISVRCNLTDFIIGSKYLFADAFAMQLCKEFLEMIAKGARIGPNPAQIKLSAIADLDPKSPGNWIKSYNDSIEALNLDMSGFSKSCMPCEDNKKGKFFSM